MSTVLIQLKLCSDKGSRIVMTTPSATSSPSQRISIPLGVWGLGLSSFLMKTSSVIIFSLTPLFMSHVLGASTFIIGIAEGVVEAFSLLTRVFAGVISDIFHKRKAIIIWGYIFATISRPIMGIATRIEWILLGRCLDRIGNGLDASPRDALVGDLAPPSIKGACYGLRESLSRGGSLAGSLLAIFLLWLTANNYQQVFWIATLPTLLGLFVLIALVHDPVKQTTQKKQARSPIKFEDIKHLPKSYWYVVLLSGSFMLSLFSGAFFILRAEQQGITPFLIPLVMVIQNVATTITAYPIGVISDKIERRWMMAIGIALLVFADVILSFANSLPFVFAGIFIWGVQLGVTQSMLVTILADHCPENLRGTGFGIFHLLNGVSLIIANSLAGYLWDHVGTWATFTASGIIASCSSVFLLFISKPKEKA